MFYLIFQLRMKERIVEHLHPQENEQKYVFIEGSEVEKIKAMHIHQGGKSDTPGLQLTR